MVFPASTGRLRALFPTPRLESSSVFFFLFLLFVVGLGGFLLVFVGRVTLCSDFAVLNHCSVFNIENRG